MTAGRFANHFCYVLTSSCALFCGACSDDASTVPDKGPVGDAIAIDGRVDIQGLAGAVDALRDEHGRTHIYASSMADALRAQGYLVARDRAVQMDFYRRVASGRTSEVFGELDPQFLEIDVTMRFLGLRRVALQMLEQATPEERAWLGAFASGVTQYFRKIRSGEEELPKGIGVIEPEFFEDWHPVDSLAYARLLSFELSFDNEAGNTQVLEGIKLAFDAASTDPLLVKRAGMERDYIRFAGATDSTTVAGFPSGATGATGADSFGHEHASHPPAGAAPDAERPAAPRGRAWRDGARRRQSLVNATRPVLDAIERLRPGSLMDGSFGSNNWAVGGERSASGRVMVASDPHLSLESPAIFWPVTMHVDGPAESLHVAGLSFVGIPGIILGHNRFIGWAATVVGYDVTDTWHEAEIAIETVEEVIEVRDADPVVYDVQLVPDHGAIIPTIVDGAVVPPDPALGALSQRWTGMQPSGEFTAVFRLLRAKNVDEAREALRHFGVGAQNWVVGDVDGGFLWDPHALIPERSDGAFSWNPASYEGTLPSFVLPGDGSAEWIGAWDDDELPWAKNLTQGYVVTANQDPVGTNIDNHPANEMRPGGGRGYTAALFAHGFRTQRIVERIEGLSEPITMDDMQSIQADHRSALGARLVPSLLVAIDAALAEQQSPGTHPDLSMIVTDGAFDADRFAAVKTALEGWRDESDYAAASGVNPDDNQPLPLDQPAARAARATLLFNVWLVRFFARVFRDESARFGRPAGTGFEVRSLLHLLESDPQTLATYDPATGDSAIWDDIDTPELESRHERMIRALLDALIYLADEVGSDIDSYRWGLHHTVRFETQVPLWNALAIPSLDDGVFPDGFPRHGDQYAVDACNFEQRRGVDADIDFSYGGGPVQRFVIDLDPAGVRARNVLPGGAVWAKDDPHFADQAEQWRRNQTHEVPFELEAVLPLTEQRLVLEPPG
jgi:penicillin amidase